MSETNLIFRLKNVPLSFPHLVKPRDPFKNTDGTTNGKPKFEANGLLDPTNLEHKATIDQIMAGVYAVAKAKELPYLATETDEDTGKSKQVDRIKQFYNGREMEKFNMQIYKGERKKDKKGTVLAGYAGKVVVCARSETRVGIVNRDSRIHLAVDEEDYNFLSQPGSLPKGHTVANPSVFRRLVYGGCIINMSVSVYAWKNNAKFGIGFDLRGIQYVGPGQAFGRAPVRVEDEFESLETEATDSSEADAGAAWDE